MVHERNPRVPWIVRTNDLTILEMAGTSRQLVTTIRRWQLGHLGHTLIGTIFEKVCLLGVVEYIRARGKQNLKYMDGIKTLVGCRTAGEVVRLAEVRGRWRSTVANVTSEDTAPRYGNDF